MNDSIPNLISRGEAILSRLPNRTDRANARARIRSKYRRMNAPGVLTREFASLVVGDAWKEVTGSDGRIGQRLASNHFKQKENEQRDLELENLERGFRYQDQTTKIIFNEWFFDSENVITNTQYLPAIRQFQGAKHAIKQQTKIHLTLKALHKLAEYDADTTPHKQSVLIKRGEPIKGLSHIENFLKLSKEYVKIQDPYPSLELLSIIEATPLHVPVSLLIGEIDPKTKSRFEERINLLRKAGRNITVTKLLLGQKAPFHDRFFITEKTCIAMGTSASGLGLRDSLISEVPRTDIEQRFNEFFDTNDPSLTKEKI